MPFLDRLHEPDPLVALELRPPRADLERGLSMDSWMAMHRAVRRMAEKDTALFFTDNAVGSKEEENLHHLVSNLDLFVLAQYKRLPTSESVLPSYNNINVYAGGMFRF